MTEKTTYVCDYCGAEFTSEEECEIHERAEKYSEFKDRIIFFDELNNPIGHAPNYQEMQDCYTIWTADEDAICFANEYLHDFGYSPIYVISDALQEGANTFYIGQDGEWHSLEYDMKELEEIQKKVKKALDNWPQM